MDTAFWWVLLLAVATGMLVHNHWWR